MSISARQRQRAAAILDQLTESYPEAACALHFRNPYELLVATILSAQCTDVRVNLVTPELFARYPDAAALAAGDANALESVIHSTGFYRNKSKNLIGCAQALVEQHGGEVPRSMAELVALPGVGRKTANVVLGNAYGIPGMVVDTHVGRVAGRLGWSDASDPTKIEADLCRLIPKDRWTLTSHLLIAHGRACCKAPTPHCSRCPLDELCPRNGVERWR
ncbi:MAG: endonuclease III [Desulfuromonadales bacterium GWD2_61_12]|nr:MAG: endonuclease III [Desulfuromonadales bacterium GWD2_61_12]